MIGSGTRLPEGTVGPVLLDADTGDLLGAALAEDPDSAYSSGHLRVLGIVDSRTVLLRVTPAAPPAEPSGGEARHLAVWHADTGAFERLASGPADLASASVAVGPLADP